MRLAPSIAQVHSDAALQFAGPSARADRRQSRPSPAASAAGGGPAAGNSTGGWASPWLALVVLTAATVCVYANSWQTPFVYDDEVEIVGSRSIRRLWPVSSVFLVNSEGITRLHPRPLVNLSFAIDYALGGLEPWHFHLTNLAIHLLAGWTLFGVVRRTLGASALQSRYGPAATPLALVAALLWMLHPLQTESVTYITQRYESLMGLCYLLTLYCAIRAATAATALAGRGWTGAAILACWLALCSKEVAISAPLVVLLHDRAFLAGSFREAWRLRRGLYLGLAGTWLAFGAMFMYTSSRGSWAGYGLPLPWWQYAWSQPNVILHYLRLAVWPHPQVLDYAWQPAAGLGEALPGALAIGALVAGTVYALFRHPGWAVCGAWFLLILAPTSSVLPLADLAVEHRMYLPLAALAALAAVGGYAAGLGLVSRHWLTSSAARLVGLISVTVAAVSLGCLTYLRNGDYRSVAWLWLDTVAKAPHNARAHANLGLALALQGDWEQAIGQYQESLRLLPNFPHAHYNLANALLHRGQLDAAVFHYEQTLEHDPRHPQAHYDLGNALLQKGRPQEAVEHLRRAVALEPEYVAAHNNLGIVLVQLGQVAEAIGHYRTVLSLDPGDVEAHFNLGVALHRQGDDAEALRHWDQALKIQPDQPLILSQIAWLRATSPDAALRQGAEAVRWAERALQVAPAPTPELLDTLAAAYAETGRFAEAAATAKRALERAAADNNQALAGELRQRLKLYESGTAFRESHSAQRPGVQELRE